MIANTLVYISLLVVLGVCRAKLLPSAIRSASFAQTTRNSAEVQPGTHSNAEAKELLRATAVVNAQVYVDNVARALASNINATDCTAVLFSLSASPAEYFDGVDVHSVLGRLAERSTSLQDRPHLLDAAWSLSHFGHTHVPLLRALRDSTLGSADVLSADDVARLVVIFQRASLSRHVLSRLDPDLAPGNAYLQQLARLAESKLSSIADVLTFSRVVEAVRVVLYPNPVSPPPVETKFDARSLAESSFSSAPADALFFSAGASTGEVPSQPPAAMRGMTEDGFNAYSYNEVEGIHRDSDRLAALVAAAAKGKTDPVEPGIMLPCADLALVPLGALVRLQYALQHLPAHTVSATSMVAIDAEISTRHEQMQNSDAFEGAFANLVDVDSLDREETAMLVRLWLASPVTKDRGLKLIASRTHRAATTTSPNTFGTASRSSIAEELSLCLELIETLRTLTATGHYNEEVATRSEQMLAAQSYRTYPSSSSSSTASSTSEDPQSRSAPLRRMDTELQFQRGVLREVLFSFIALKK